MPQMSKAEVSYYLDRLRYFRSDNQLASLLNVTYPTFVRWRKFETLPSVTHRNRFQELFDDLLDELDDQGQLGSDIADALTRERPPQPRAAVKVPANRQILRDLIVDMLSGRRYVRSTRIFREAEQYGFSKVVVHMEAKKLGVIKDQRGQGRGSYSLWRLP